MAISPGSRGKGGRRAPGRGGGRGKAKALAVWRKHAQHAVKSLSELTEPKYRLTVAGFYGDSLADTVYSFDQCMAKLGVHYYAECTGRRHRWTIDVWVAADRAPAVQEIIARIRKAR